MERTFARFSWGVLAYNLAVIVWGAFVRATGSGAGCGAHWPMCNGEVVPREPSLETMIELTHRATSGLALVLVVAQLMWALNLFPRGHRTRSLAITTMVLMCLEALIGAGIVLLRLVEDDQSVARAGWIAMHLVNTFLLVAALTLTPWSVTHTERAPSGRGGLSSALSFGAIGLLVIGIAGAITALGDTLFPAESLASGVAADLSDTAHFLVRLRVIHPVIAALGSVYLLVLAAFLALTRRSGRHGHETRTLSIAVACLVVVQLLAGLLNLALLAPVWMQLVHLVLADLLWIAFVLMSDAASHTVARPAQALGTAEVPR